MSGRPAGFLTPTGAALALQLALPSMLTLVYPSLVLRSVNTPPALIASTLAWTLFALAAAAVLQSFRRGPVGSGLLLPALSSGLHLAPSMLAIKVGGLPLLAGMTVFSALGEAVFAASMRWLKPLFTPAIIGIILFLVGMEIGLAGVRTIVTEALGRAGGEAPVVLLALAGLLILAIAWERGGPLFRTLAPLVVFIAATVADRWIHPVPPSGLGFVAFPAWPSQGFAFHAWLALPFLAAAIASALRTAGGVQVLHETVDAPGNPRPTGGVAVDAAGTLLCGLAGSIGTCVALNAIAAEKAARLADRRLAWLLALFLAVPAFCPRFLEAIASAPGSATGPLLIFYGLTMALPGLQEIVRDRESPGFVWQAGLPLIFAMGTLALPGWLETLGLSLSPLERAFLGSMLTPAVFAAIAIRLIILIVPTKKTPE